MNPIKTSPRRSLRLGHSWHESHRDCGKSGAVAAGSQRFARSEQWDKLIQTILQKKWPDADWKLIKCQVRRESAFNPQAVSPCGAIGLMQIMPATGQYLGVSREKLFNPETNLKTGIAYLKQQYDHFPEISDPQERLKFALASYNGGRGYINRAIALARKEDAPWQNWDGVKNYLAAVDCTVGGKHPDHRQIINYVDRIWNDYARLSVFLRERVRAAEQDGVNGP